MSVVHIASCRNYEQSEVFHAVERLLGTPEITGRIPDGGIVLLKPNLLSARKGPEVPVNTHTAVIESTARYLKEKHRCTVWIGDSCNSLSGESTRSAFRCMGLDDLAAALDLRLIDFNSDRSRVLEIHGSSRWDRVRVAASYFDADLVITVPKLKTHTLCGLTLSVKNMIGVAQGGEKRRMHAIAPGPDVFAEVVVDLYSLLCPGLTLIDAVWAMEGDGPGCGDPVYVGALLASADPVAADVIASTIAGFSVTEVPVLTRAGARGCGLIDPGQIILQGDPLESLKNRPFRRPAGSVPAGILLRILPEKWLKSMARLFMGHLPRIRSRLCTGCGACAGICPAGAIRLVHGKARIIPDLCQECYCCQELCPYDAVKVSRKPYAWFVR